MKLKRTMGVSKKLRIAVCFFGITRSLSKTITSIERNIITPAHELGEVRIFGHFFEQAEINNPRSGENSSIVDVDEYKFLQPHWISIQKPDVFIDQKWFDQVKQYGDQYDDGFISIRNLIHQLESLQQVSRAALTWSADVYIFARPDIMYHDGFAKVLELSRTAHRDTIYLPTWAHWGPGYNDRFCVCAGDSPARAYAERLVLVPEFCASHGSLHAEKLVRFSVKKSGVRVRFFSVRGSRVRSNGKVVKENFMDFRLVMLKDLMKLPYRRTLRIWKRLRY